PVFDDPSVPAGSVRGKLEGTGFIPKIEVKGDTLLPPIVINTVHPKKGYFTIKSTGDTALFIEQIRINPNSPAINDFTFDPTNPPPTNVVLPKGGELKIPLIFKPTFINERKVTVEVLSDKGPGTPENPDPRTWDGADIVGYAYDKGITADSIDYGLNLQCDNPEGEFIITNTSSSTFTIVDSVVFVSGDKEDFEILGSFPQTIIQKGELKVKVRFLHNTNKTDYTVLYRVYNDGTESDAYIQFKGKTFTVPVNFYLDSLYNMAPGMETSELFQKLPVSVLSGRWDAAKVTDFEFDIMYKSRWMIYENQVGKAELTNMTSWNLTGTEQSVDNEWSKLTVRGTTNNPDDFIKGNGVLCYPRFLILLSDASEYRPYISRISFFDKDSCIIPKPDTGLITFDICVQDLRNITFPGNGLNYALHDISPNPIIGSSFTIEYEIALKGSQTTIQIFNSINELVSTIVSEQKNPGRYSEVVTTDKLASGVYYIYIKSGPFTDMKRVVITK
ncbi:MAG: hypothetical protein QG635_889, partial [Bacteroidota bacterium]|nr:hypothetical protein [Bacteroidota bacterium]